MEIEFDPNKNAINRRKHGVSLTAAADLDFEAAAVFPDERRDYSEARFRAYGWIGQRMHVLAFTMRGNVLRVISLRKANSKELKAYGRQA